MINGGSDEINSTPSASASAAATRTVSAVADALRRGIALTSNAPERRHLERELAGLDRPDSSETRPTGLAPLVARTQTVVVLDEDMQRVVREQRLGYVASVCPDGTPNLSPKGTMAVWDAEHLVFAHLHSPQTVANIEAGNSIVEINVVDPIVRKGYRFKGPASVHRHGALYESGVRFFHARNGLERDRIQAIVLVRVELAIPLTSPAYDDGSSEEDVEQRSLRMYGLKRLSTRGCDAGSTVVDSEDDQTSSGEP
jgi:predicted pyridoxine 5'-phosphate oxidase superfamily flavin-nucleotide-binding protein